MLVHTQASYILHSRPFRDTSQIIEVFSRDYGRHSVLSKGSRGPKSKIKGLLRPFYPLLLSWGGRGELPVLRNVDVASTKPPILKGKVLVSALYLNELLFYFLHKHDVHTKIFDHYHEVLFKLSTQDNIEPCLRLFEKFLLDELGFGLNLVVDADSGESIREDLFYVYHCEHGPVVAKERSSKYSSLISGRNLLALQQENLDSVQNLNEIKGLMRTVINHHLGSKKLKTRDLFRKPAVF